MRKLYPGNRTTTLAVSNSHEGAAYFARNRMDRGACQPTRHPTACFAAVFACTAAVVAQPAEMRLRPQNTELSKPLVDVPLDFPAGAPVIEVMVNERGPLRFAVETGQTYTQIDEDVAVLLRLNVSDTSAPPEDRNRKPRPWRTSQVKSVSIDGAVFSSLDIRVIPKIGKKETERKFVGVLGAGLFADCVASLDYAGKRFKLTTEGLPVADGKEIFDAKTNYGRLALPVKLKGQVLDAVIASGTPTVFTVSDELWDKIDVAADEETREQGPRLLSVKEAPPLRSDVPLGPHTLVKPPIRFHASEDSLLGLDVLRHFTVTLDGKNLRIRLARESTDPLTFPASGIKFGIVFMRAQNELRIHKVIPDSPAFRLPIEESDFVLEINSTPPEAYDDRELRTLLAHNHRLVLKLSKNGLPLLVPVEAR